MKYFIDAITAVRALREVWVNEEGTLSLRKRSVSIILAVFGLLIGLHIAVAVQFVSGVLLLPIDGILCCLFLCFVFLNQFKSAPPVMSTCNPRQINVADLLERKIVHMEITEARALLQGQVILVTGAAGSIGSELCRQLLDCEPELLIALDMNETGLFDLVESLRSRSHAHLAHLYPFIGDITDVQRMGRLFAEKRPKIVFHAAAYKHVPLLEQFPDLAIRINALATYHLCRLAQEYQVARFVFISTDKAADPVSVMGASKRLGEIIVQAMAKSTNGMTRFCAVRFGNVIGSRGSVFPVFTQQIEQGGPLTVTDPRATRYFMTIPEACGLLILASAMPDEEGGLYLLDMGDPVRILDLAVKMVSLSGLRIGLDISIVYTGLRPGERLYETLIAVGEELKPTTNSKIFCIAQREALPSIEKIAQWIDSLEDSLWHHDDEQLREYLLEIVGHQSLLIADEMSASF